MTPPLPPQQAAGQSVFYLADSREAANTVNRVMGKRLATILKGPSGCLLKFQGTEDYLMILGSKLPVFGNPIRTGTADGMMEIPITGLRDVIAVSLSGAGMRLEPKFWAIWEDEEAQKLVGMALTGYTPSRSRVETGEEYPSAMLEFNAEFYLVVTPVSVYVMKRDKPLRVS